MGYTVALKPQIKTRLDALIKIYNRGIAIFGSGLDRIPDDFENWMKFSFPKT